MVLLVSNAVSCWGKPEMLLNFEEEDQKTAFSSIYLRWFDSDRSFNYFPCYHGLVVRPRR
jgi:hypothetical protein